MGILGRSQFAQIDSHTICCGFELLTIVTIPHMAYFTSKNMRRPLEGFLIHLAQILSSDLDSIPSIM